MWGEAGRAQLEAWGISEQEADSVGMFEIDDAGSIMDVPHRPGVVIPYYQPDGSLLHVKGKPFARIRWTDTRKASAFHGRVKAPRYGQPKNTGIQVYFPPLIPWDEVLADATRPIIITEGEAKAITACLNGYVCIALGGVYNFAEAGQLVPVLANAQWAKRPVALIYDSDAATNPDVLAAEARLVDELGTQRRAAVRIVRLPDDGGDKVGLDDFLHKHGAAELDKLIETANDLGALDAKVIGLNRHCAWIQQEDAVYELKSGLIIRRESFTNGSQYSTLTHMVAAGPKAAPKTISVASTWLKHPHAQRYAQLLFRPGEEAVVHGKHGTALNLWQGWNAEPGDVTPWLKLTEYLFSKENNPEVRELPLKIAAYKAQNPQVKVPLALVMTGPQGSGKTLWADLVREAFSPYSATVEPTALASDFHPWLEKSVVATINEMDVPTLIRSAEMLKALITDPHRNLNDKFRIIREIQSPTFYFITSNWSGVGAGFAADDRRMITIETPGHGPEEMYSDVLRWRAAGGAKFLMHYLLNYDLKGWQPPQQAPMTASKRMAYREGMTPIQLLAADMRESNFNTIMLWLETAAAYASALEVSGDAGRAAQGRAIMQGLGGIQVRPWYTSEELAMIFAPVMEQVYAIKQRGQYGATTPGMVSRQLRDAGIPFLVNRDNPDGFEWQGRMRQYLVISDFDEWKDAIGQKDFERAMRNWPTYAQIKRDMVKGQSNAGTSRNRS